MKRYIIALVCLSFTVMGSVVTAAESQAVDALQIELLVFSGRPNPKLIVSDPQLIREITGLVGKLPKHPDSRGKQTVTPNHLGYRGFLIENVSSSAPELETILIYRANVEVRRKNGPGAAEFIKEFRLDGSAGLERKLIELVQAKGLITEDLAKHVRGEK